MATCSKATTQLITFFNIHVLYRGLILEQVMIYRRLRIGRDMHLDQSEAYDYRNLYKNMAPGVLSSHTLVACSSRL